MGFFSPKKTISVASSAYNMAGDIAERPNYLKTTIIGSVLNPNPVPTFAEGLTGAYLHGPGMRLRHYPRWARDSGYRSYVGLPAGTLALSADVDKSVVAGEIPSSPGETVEVQRAYLDSADFTVWADKWISENYPAEFGTNYTVDFNESTNELTITLADTSVHVITLTDFDPKVNYLFATYLLSTGASSLSVVTGSVVDVTGGSFPSMTGWTTNSFTTTPLTMNLDTRTQVTVTWSDATPGSYSDTTTTTTQAYNETHGEYERTTYQGWDYANHRRWSLREIEYQDAVGTKVTNNSVVTVVDDMGGGVFRTTVTETDTDVFVLEKTYRIDTQDIIHEGGSPIKIFIYPENSGNATLDSLFIARTDSGDFHAFIPLRVNNSFVAETGPYDWLYPYAKRAMRRSISTKFDQIIDKIADNPDLDDIDYAYVVFGAALNSPEPTAKRYIYEFFQEMMLGEDLSGDEFSDWRDAWLLAKAAEDYWVAWRDAQSNPLDPLYNTASPGFPVYPTAPTKTVRIASTDNIYINYDMTITWNGVAETTGSGECKPGAKEGEVFIEKGTSESYTEFVNGDLLGDSYNTYDIEKILIWYQETDTSWRRLEIAGLSHKNMIYGGKFVQISAFEAMDDTEESGFIIPLHETIYKRLSLVPGTQLTTGCCYLVFNCYQIVKQKWYQTAWFKILLIVIVVAITVATGGLGAESIGLLGTNFAVGSALGFTGVTATIVGAAVNAIAAMLLTKLITMLSVSIFGDKIGAIIGAVASIVAMNIGTSFFNGSDILTGLDQLTRADNIIKITSAVGKGISEGMQAEAQETVAKIREFLADYAAQLKELAAKSQELFGNETNAAINPAMFQGNIVSEPVDGFLNRTLMTGSDVAQFSFNMVIERPAITLNVNTVI